ncbi:alpha/beta fold hydrolase [Marivita sp. GX14005]|uniref:PHA/PHB synthase family protein n=1 Tax=Marivita sp. GX14005 TaxID=2942276 RepID=UPI002019CB03|nr:alpha/beta fold hydrolase [Marivita sp. GX14005]MCL3882946.1 alpha/beta fold hydrolase [Marivita sp. GX14005]
MAEQRKTRRKTPRPDRKDGARDTLPPLRAVPDAPGPGPGTAAPPASSRHVSPELSPPCAATEPDGYSTQMLDRAIKAHMARFTRGVTPFGLSSRMFNWWVHLAGSPGKQLQLAEKAVNKATRFAMAHASPALSGRGDPCILPLDYDKRFDAPEWQRWPYNMIYQSFLMAQQWWYNATNNIDGMSAKDEKVISFVARQMLDMMSPSNAIWTNPEVLAHTAREGGANLVRGMQNLMEDWQRAASRKPPVGAEDYLPGREVAVTPGKVVWRSHLMELIQYAPQTDTARPEPLLIVPAWIMKYYILDLSPHNSLVQYLVEQGFTVFMISWRNPDAEDRDLGMADYLGAVEEALDVIGRIVPDERVHGIGYCLGGTLLTAKAAQMARDGDDRLKTLSLFAAQTDFEDPGELQLFISESEVSFLEHMMWDQGYLDTSQMAGAFQLLRSKDLIWSRYVHEYLMGRRQPMFDLMAWNADATRMPYRMHSEYLRQIFLDNELAKGQYRIGGKPVAITDIDAPIFCVSTTGDHVAPWQSVYKLHLLTDTDVTFVLTSGGHNAGIVSEPGHKGRSYRIAMAREDDPYTAPEDWRARVPEQDGSWWPELVRWLGQRSGKPKEPPQLGVPGAPDLPSNDAPGIYVHQR